MDLQIKYDNGQMTIHMDAFFPASQARLKKLLKVVDLDHTNKENHIQMMETYFNEQMLKLEEERKSFAKLHLEYRQKAADTQTMVESRKKPNGVSLTKEELADCKDSLKEFKRLAGEHLQCHNRCQRKKQQFKSNLEILKQRK